MLESAQLLKICLELVKKKDETYIFKDCRYLKAIATYCAKSLHAPTMFNKVQFSIG